MVSWVEEPEKEGLVKRKGVETEEESLVPWLERGLWGKGLVFRKDARLKHVR